MPHFFLETETGIPTFFYLQPIQGVSSRGRSASLIVAFFAMVVLGFAGCSKKAATKNDSRTVTTEVVAAVQRISNNKSQIIVRPQQQASKRGSSSTVDDIYISLVTPSEAPALNQSLTTIAGRHGLAVSTTVASAGIWRFDYTLNGSRTHSLTVVI